MSKRRTSPTGSARPRWRGAWAFVAAVLLLAAGCAREAEAPPAQSGPAEKLRVSLSMTPASLSVLIAQEQGYFRARGVELTVKEVAAGVLALGEVARGESDLALAAETPFVLAALDGQPLTLLARLYSSGRASGIVARRDLGIVAPADLAGRRIGVMPRTSAAFFLDLFLGTNGVDPNSVTRVALKPQELDAALASGEVEAASTWDPHVVRLHGTLGERGIVFADPAIYELTFNLIAHPRFVTERAAALQRAMAAILDAEAFMQREPEQARSLAARLQPASRAPGEAPAWRADDFRASVDQALLALLERQALWAGEGSEAARRLNVLQVVDGTALAAVAPARVRIVRAAGR